MKLQYSRFRYYDPETGRWLTQDPIGYWDSMNLDEYCYSDPLNWLDPYGLDSLHEWLKGNYHGMEYLVCKGAAGAYGAISDFEENAPPFGAPVTENPLLDLIIDCAGVGVTLTGQAIGGWDEKEDAAREWACYYKEKMNENYRRSEEQSRSEQRWRERRKREQEIEDIGRILAGHESLLDVIEYAAGSDVMRKVEWIRTNTVIYWEPCP